MPIENCKFRIPLKMQPNDDSIAEIDAVVCIETEAYQDEEFPNLYEATRLFYELVDIDMYGLFHHNYDVIKKWVKEAWKPEYAKLLEADCRGEWEYQLIESISQLISGNVGEKTAERYVGLFKRVPAKPDEMVLVPAHDVMIEGEVVAGPQNGGVK